MNKTSSLLLASALLAAPAFAGVPLNGLQGNGGIAFNPVAFLAGTYADDDQVVSAPQVGTWYTHLDSADIDWAAASVSLSVAKRVELSYGYGWTDANKYGDSSVNSHNIGAKLALLNGGEFDQEWLPAVAVGAVYKHTDAATADALGLDKSGADFYAVATKLLSEDTPIPVLLSAGIQASDEVVNGVVGHGDYGFGWFGNINLIPISEVTVGAEYKSGIDTDDVHNHDYYDLHAAWFVDPSLTLVAAYVNTGSKSGSRLGVGDGFVLSAQYQF